MEDKHAFEPSKFMWIANTTHVRFVHRWLLQLVLNAPTAHWLHNKYGTCLTCEYYNIHSKRNDIPCTHIDDGILRKYRKELNHAKMLVATLKNVHISLLVFRFIRNVSMLLKWPYEFQMIALSINFWLMICVSCFYYTTKWIMQFHLV